MLYWQPYFTSILVSERFVTTSFKQFSLQVPYIQGCFSLWVETKCLRSRYSPLLWALDVLWTWPSNMQHSQLHKTPRVCALGCIIKLSRTCPGSCMIKVHCILMNVTSFAKLDGCIRPHVRSPQNQNVDRETQKAEKQTNKPQTKPQKHNLEILFYI